MKTEELSASARQHRRAALLSIYFYFSKRSKTNMPTFCEELLPWSEIFTANRTSIRP